MTSSSSKRWLRRLAIAGVVLAMAPVTLWATLELIAREGVYDVGALAPPHGSTRIYDARGRLLREATGTAGLRTEWVPLASVSPLAIDATIAAEDASFRDHDGVRWRSLARAVGQAITHGHVVSGASTLTMQVVRLVHPHERSLAGKLGEIVDALRLERAASKDEIVENYVNRSPYGAGTVGIESASRRYFGKPSMHLSLAEAALLAGLPQAPSRLDPLVHREAGKARQRLVLERMATAGMIDGDQLSRALAEELHFVAVPPAPSAMHFTDWVLSLQPHDPSVATSLDGDLQLEVERMVRDHVAAHRLAGMTDAAVVVLDNAHCNVLAMVGSPDYGDPRGGAVNAATSLRQPGSTLKPFTYALAFERGDTPASVVADVETRYGAADGFLYNPQNYSQTYAGPVLMDDALARSLNVPALKTLEKVGVQTLLDRLHAVGFASLTEPASHYGLGLTLGDGEVTLVELAQAYAMFARGGLTCAATPFPSAPDAGKRAFSPSVAWLVTDILSDETIRAAAFGPANALMMGYPVAVKTGTSSNWRDSWAVGYTPRYTIAVWAGDHAGHPMNKLAGAAGAGPLFRNVVDRLVGQLAGTRRPEKPAMPDDVVEVSVCALSGELATPGCAHARSMHVPRDHVPNESCTWHRDVAIDRRNGLLAGEHCPARFVEHRVVERLPATYAQWLTTAPARDTGPRSYSPLCPRDGAIPDSVVVTYPREHEVFVVEPGYDPTTQTLAFTALVDPMGSDTTWLVDGRQVTSTWQLARGAHTVQAVADGRRSDPVNFDVR